MRLVRIGLLLVVAAGAAAALAWYMAAPPRVEVVTPSRGPAVEAVYATGTVEPKAMARIGPQVSGRIAALPVEEGAAVVKGQVLARLDDDEAVAHVAELEARLRFLEAAARRASELSRRGHISPQALDQAESEAQAARAALAVGRQQLAEYTLTAPFDGILIRQDGEVGEVVGKGDVLVWVGCCAPFRVEAEVDEEDIPRVRLDQPALIRADAYPQTVLTGRVDEITPKGDPIARSYRVRIRLPADSPLLIGMTVEVNIVVEERAEALLVPTGAVVRGRVWTVVEGRLVRREVRVGVVGPERTEVRAGLDEAAQVVLRPGEGLSEGARVRPIPAAGG